MNIIGKGVSILVAMTVFSEAVEAGTMDDEIDFLLTTVGSSECVFIRNGDQHEAAAAQKHLQMKRKRGKRYYDNADEFIEKLASKSSFSGKLYYIQCGDEAEQPAGEWFSAALSTYRAQQH